MREHTPDYDKYILFRHLTVVEAVSSGRVSTTQNCSGYLKEVICQLWRDILIQRDT